MSWSRGVVVLLLYNRIMGMYKSCSLNLFRFLSPTMVKETKDLMYPLYNNKKYNKYNNTTVILFSFIQYFRGSYSHMRWQTNAVKSAVLHFSKCNTATVDMQQEFATGE